ncbi:hypothetical protein HYH03_011129 [Edaphochlamys debaryana]|uniref:Uncharacterized protein n=1 Tax=Edaphochlamys debaryana TaxID=47281 RepID=A0A835XVS2_9CHLO|nr:hypothetical protein HYH03_011129 [Edaphochlamys debaryana]|eukprot:KAG2490507.1 hypothetical protein HYH03_011129 [Edaphochlamys debaryana]
MYRSRNGSTAPEVLITRLGGAPVKLNSTIRAFQDFRLTARSPALLRGPSRYWLVCAVTSGSVRFMGSSHVAGTCLRRYSLVSGLWSGTSAAPPTAPLWSPSGVPSDAWWSQVISGLGPKTFNSTATLLFAAEGINPPPPPSPKPPSPKAVVAAQTRVAPPTSSATRPPPPRPPTAGLLINSFGSYDGTSTVLVAQGTTLAVSYTVTRGATIYSLGGLRFRAKASPSTPDASFVVALLPGYTSTIAPFGGAARVGSSSWQEVALSPLTVVDGCGSINAYWVYVAAVKGDVLLQATKKAPSGTLAPGYGLVPGSRTCRSSGPNSSGGARLDLASGQQPDSAWWSQTFSTTNYCTSDPGTTLVFSLSYDHYPPPPPDMPDIRSPPPPRPLSPPPRPPLFDTRPAFDGTEFYARQDTVVSSAWFVGASSPDPWVSSLRLSVKASPATPGASFVACWWKVNEAYPPGTDDYPFETDVIMAPLGLTAFKPGSTWSEFNLVGDNSQPEPRSTSLGYRHRLMIAVTSGDVVIKATRAPGPPGAFTSAYAAVQGTWSSYQGPGGLGVARRGSPFMAGGGGMNWTWWNTIHSVAPSRDPSVTLVFSLARYLG